jgi:hypothetical protein
MRRLAVIAAAVVAAAFTVVGCSPAATPSPPPDPQTVLTAAGQASYPSRLEITVSGSYTSAGSTTQLPDGLLTIDVDTSTGVGSVHLAVPTSLLGTEGAAALAQLGVTGDSLSFDVLYDGSALYAKSAVLPALVSQLAVLAPTAQIPQVTADTWARLIDQATLKELASSAGGAVESTAPSASSPAADAKAILDEIGATLTLGPDTTGPGGPAHDIQITVDPAKAKAYIEAHPDQFPTTQLQTLSSMGSLTSLSADALIDVATSRLEQLTLSASGTESGTETSLSLKIGIAEAPSSVTFTTPSGAVDLPLVTILGPMISGLMSSGGLPIPSLSPAP